VVYSAVRDLRITSLKGHLQYFKERSHYERVTEFIANFSKKTTTAHVVTEISSWIIQKTDPKGHFAIWGRVYGEFSSMGMDEDVLKLVQMPQQLVADFGATDAGILQLAASLRQNTPTVLSVDSGLIAECKRAGVDAKDLWEVIFS
jgi:hypothetical protein